MTVATMISIRRGSPIRQVILTRRAIQIPDRRKM
jgi:hypothetical protein